MSDTTTIVPPPDLSTLPPIFAECAAKESARYSIETAWVADGYTWATNGQIIVRKPTDAPNTNTGESEWPKYPPSLQLRWAGPWTPVDFPAVPAPLPIENCSHCGGIGECEQCTCGHAHECGKCKGVGMLPQRCVSLALTPQVGLSDHYARLLEPYGVSLFVHMQAKDLSRHPIRFTTPDGCEGLVMPRAFDKAPHAK